MTVCSKEVREIEMKFYANHDSLALDDFTFMIVEVEGATPPTSIVKTVLKDKYEMINIGPTMAYVGNNNLASARFQLIKRTYDIPVSPYKFTEDVYIFECFI